MTDQLQLLLDASRGPVGAQDELNRVLEAEERIRSAAASDPAGLRTLLTSQPQDAQLSVWRGLAHMGEQRWQEALEAFEQARQQGLKHWRLDWYQARTAREVGRLELVDACCARVLAANPEFWFARELPKHARGFYSQCGQERVIEDFFQRQPPRNKVFAEVGAFDGVHYSNVRRLREKHGWTGVSIEPVGKNFLKLQASYRDGSVQCVRAAVSNREGELELNVSTYPHLPGWGSDVATFSEAETTRWQQYGAQWAKEKVVVKRLDTILAECGVGAIDLLSVDAEGHDLEVLESLDFNRFRPALIVVEYGRHREPILRFFQDKGYSLWLDNKQDLFMARIDHGLDGDGLPPTRNYTGSSGRPPYEEIQRDVETKLADFTGQPNSEVERIVIVGGYLGHEVKQMLESYPKAEIHIFEPSRRYYPKLHKNFAHNARIFCHNVAVGDREGTLTFHEGSLEGVGSLLPLKTKPDSQTWIPDKFKPAETYTVNVVTLDTFAPLRGKGIDLLWCDVQGAELQVLRGAAQTLDSVRVLMLEVAAHKTTYHGQCLLGDLQAQLRRDGFYLAGVGLCHSGNGTGNSVWLRLPRQDLGDGQGTTAGRIAEFANLQVVPPNELPPLLSRLNPHLVSLNLLPTGREARTGSVPPGQLLTADRFDLPAKHLYARHRKLGIQSGWAKQLYSEHIRALSGGACQEGDGSKSNLDDYLVSFDKLLETISAQGFDAQRSLVPVGRDGVIIDGSHRVAACLVANQPVGVLTFPLRAKRYDSHFFLSRGLAPQFADAMALEYCRLKPNTYIATVFPSAAGKDDEIRAILESLSSIVYAKQIKLTPRGAWNLIRQMYRGEPWLGDWSNNFAGVAGKMKPCFQQNGPLRLFVFETDDLAKAKEAKARIRTLFEIENHSVHINDTHAETLYLGGMLLNDNSIHFLNHAQARYFERFERHFNLYRDWLAKQGRDLELFCIDGSAVLSAYGVRDAQDLDILHAAEADFSEIMPGVNSHNSEAHHHDTTRDDIIFNPRNHFYFLGLKFASLDIIQRLKTRRDEGKDRADIRMTRQLLAGRSPKLSKPNFVLRAWDRLITRGARKARKKSKAAALFEFTNDWFKAHEKQWNEHLRPWARKHSPLNILEIGSYEGRSSCWFLTQVMDDSRSHLTCVDTWVPAGPNKVPGDEAVYQRFLKNCQATGRPNQLTVLRGDSKELLKQLPDRSFDLIYVDGEHSTPGVYADTRQALRLLKPRGRILWDDYLWSEEVRTGVDKACAEHGIQVEKFGQNVCYQKPASP